MASEKNRCASGGAGNDPENNAGDLKDDNPNWGGKQHYLNMSVLCVSANARLFSDKLNL